MMAEAGRSSNSGRRPVINLRSGAALRLTIPQALLVHAVGGDLVMGANGRFWNELCPGRVVDDSMR